MSGAALPRKLDAGALDHVAPALALLGNEGAELFRRIATDSMTTLDLPKPATQTER